MATSIESAKASQSRKAVIVGIGGCSSSGKTTLSRILRDILPNTSILHEDDFYKSDHEIPTNPSGLQDWDCPDSLDIPSLVSALDHIHTQGILPPNLLSKEDQNTIPSPLEDPHLSTSSLRDYIVAHLSTLPLPPIILLDGFLLYANSVAAVRDRLDVKLFLRTSYAKAKARRQSRAGYVTLEGFWTDPPGYVDEVVWPNYVKEHAFLFRNGDVHGEVHEGVVSGLRARVLPREEEERGVVGVVEWAVRVLVGELRRVVDSERG